MKNVKKDTRGWHNKPKSTLSGHINFEEKEAREYFKQQMKPLFDAGLDFFKLDGSTWIPCMQAAFETTQELGKETKSISIHSF